MAFNLQNFLCPIERQEWKKFLPMAFMMFFIIFNLAILRTTKEALVLSQPGSGVEVLSFIKTYCVIPISLGYMVVYVILSNHYSQRRIFYFSVVPFFVFFMLYAFVLHPNLGEWHISPVRLAEIQHDYPSMKWFAVLLGNWGFTLFFIMSELWSAIVLSLMFWQFANDITTSPQAKRFYGLFGLIGNFGLVFGGFAIMACSHCPVGVDKVVAWGEGVRQLMVIAGMGVGAILLLYFWMTTVLGFKRAAPNKASVEGIIKKPKPTFREQILYVTQSKHLQYLFIIVVAFFLALNFSEVLFKDRVLQSYQEGHEYSAFMGRLQTAIGVVSIILTFIGSSLLRYFSWKGGALITPILMFASTTVFLGLVLYMDFLSISNGLDVAVMIVWIGFAQTITMRATKYSFFDPTREMIYIPLDRDLRTKGKACVDLLGGRLGKGGGAWIQSIIFMFTGLGFKELTPALYVMICGLIIVWVIAIVRLSKIHIPQDAK